MTQDEYYDLLNKAKSVSLLNIDDSASFNRGDKKLMVGLLENKRSANPASAVNYKKIQERIKEGIKSLPEKQRLVLSLYYYEDLKGLQIKIYGSIQKGIVKDVFNFGSGEVLEVSLDDREATIYIPFDRDNVRRIDLSNGEILLTPIKGLLT